jgi:hypothetical protein
MRWLVFLAGLVAAVSLPQISRAQVEIQNNFKYNSGQDIQPVFEGWSKNPDGSFVMHFGYLNRNWVETLTVPVGPANSIDPGGPDRGQPTFFYTRTNRNLFNVTVPKDWGKKELVWTITANGKTEKAYAWLQPEWEIDPAGGAGTGGRQDEEFLKNKPPTIAIAPVSTATTSSPLTLNATVTDDGLPKPAPPRKPAVGQETPPILQGGPDAPVNVPQLAGTGRGAGAAGAGRGQAPQGPTVTWIVWRGPANVTFEPRVAPTKDSKSQATATFTKPGEYVLRGRASDRLLSAFQDVKVSVK